MALELVWLSEAEQDLGSSMAYLEEQRVGLGFDLMDEIERVITPALTHPRLYPELRPGIRRATTKRFGYNVFYRIEGEALLVVALIHSSQSPESWPV